MDPKRKPARPKAPAPPPPPPSSSSSHVKSSSTSSPSLFRALLYRCSNAEKQWIAVTKTLGTIAIAFDDPYRVEAIENGRTTISFEIHGEMKVRCKDMFVQWGSKNDVEMYGARFASKEASDQFRDCLTNVVSKSNDSKKKTPPPTISSTDLKIRVHLPAKQTTVVAVPQNFTMLKLLCLICERRHLNPRHHTLTLPPPGPGKEPISFSGSTRLTSLDIQEVHLVALTNGNATGGEGGGGGGGGGVSQLRLIVHLPYHGEKTVVAVPPQQPLPAFLDYLCEKRNLKRDDCSLELLSGRHKAVNMTLRVGDLKVNEIRLLHKKGSLKRSSCVIPPKGLGNASPSKPDHARQPSPAMKTKSHPQYGHIPLVPLNIAPQWERLFQIAGISSAHVSDPKICKALNQFVLAKGGLEAFLKDEKAAASVCGSPGFRAIMKLDSKPPPPRRKASPSSLSTSSAGSSASDTQSATPRKKKPAPLPPRLAALKPADSEPNIASLSQPTRDGGERHARASSTPAPVVVQNVKRKAPAPPPPSPLKPKSLSESDKSKSTRDVDSPKKIRLGPSRPPGPPPVGSPVSPVSGDECQLDELPPPPLPDDVGELPSDDLPPPPPVDAFEDEVFLPPPPPPLSTGDGDDLSGIVAMDVDELPPPLDDLSEPTTPMRGDLQSSFEMEMNQLVSLLDSVAAEAEGHIKEETMKNSPPPPPAPKPSKPSKPPPPVIAKKPAAAPPLPTKPPPPIGAKPTPPKPKPPVPLPSPMMNQKKGEPVYALPIIQKPARTSPPPRPPIPFDKSPLARRRAGTLPSPQPSPRSKRLAPPIKPIPYANSPAAKRKELGSVSPKQEPIYAKVVKRGRSNTLPLPDDAPPPSPLSRERSETPPAVLKALVLSDGTGTVRGVKGQVRKVVGSFPDVNDAGSEGNSPRFEKKPSTPPTSSTTTTTTMSSERKTSGNNKPSASIVFTIPPPPPESPPPPSPSSLTHLLLTNKKSPPSPLLLEETTDSVDRPSPLPPPLPLDVGEEAKDSIPAPDADLCPSPDALPPPPDSLFTVDGGDDFVALPPPPIADVDELFPPPSPPSMSKQSSTTSLPPPPPSLFDDDVAEDKVEDSLPAPPAIEPDVSVDDTADKVVGETAGEDVEKEGFAVAVPSADSGLQTETQKDETPKPVHPTTEEKTDVNLVEDQNLDISEAEPSSLSDAKTAFSPREEIENAEPSADVSPTPLPDVALDGNATTTVEDHQGETIDAATSNSPTDEPSNDDLPPPVVQTDDDTSDVPSTTDVNRNDPEAVPSTPEDVVTMTSADGAAPTEPLVVPNVSDDEPGTVSDPREEIIKSEPDQKSDDVESSSLPVQPDDVSVPSPDAASLPQEAISNAEEPSTNGATKETDPAENGQEEDPEKPHGDSPPSSSSPPPLPPVDPPSDDVDDGTPTKKSGDGVSPHRSLSKRSHSQEDLLSSGGAHNRTSVSSSALSSGPHGKKGLKLRWNSELDLRTLYGEYSDTYSEVLTDIREGKQQSNLRKIPDVQPRRKSTGHTGMAAALFDALDVRRKKMIDRRKSNGFDENEEDGGEWE